MTDPAIATAADYADAMYTARRAKNLLVLLIFIMLLVQLGIFFVARYTNYIITSPAATQPTPQWIDGLHYLIGLCAFGGVIVAIILSFVLLLIVNIMLVGRLIGVAQCTSAYIWCLLLLVLVFPWQAFLSNATFTDPGFKWPGVLYIWSELVQYAKFPGEMSKLAFLKWTRFVAFPVIAIIIVLGIQIKSNRGLRLAFGETEPDAT